MMARTGPATLPIRRWLMPAFLAVLLVPIVAAAIVGLSLGGAPDDAGDIAVRDLRSEVARWDDPAWQLETRSDLTERGVDVVLFDGGSETFRTVVDPVVGSDGEAGSRQVRSLSVTDSVDGSKRTAYVYSDDTLGTGPPLDRRYFWVPITVLLALLLTVAAIAWFLSRTVVRPLAAASSAARRIAAGDLDVALPPSRVREVADLNETLRSMATALRTSIREQAAVEQERRFFIGAVAHDLRTPLFALRGYLEGLQQDVANSPEKRRRYLAVAQDKAAALERLIADLFAYTRLEVLDQSPNREPLELRRILEAVADGLRRQAEADGVTLAVTLPDQPCVVTVDGHLLTRAIENVVDNALRHTPEGGTVELACQPGQGGVIFTVSDTGPGIESADLPHLFAPLYRAETSRNRQTGGAGLGLTIARRILLAHGGDLSAANGSGMFRGAVFTGTIPVP